MSTSAGPKYLTIPLTSGGVWYRGDGGCGGGGGGGCGWGETDCVFFVSWRVGSGEQLKCVSGFFLAVTLMSGVKEIIWLISGQARWCYTKRDRGKSGLGLRPAMGRVQQAGCRPVGGRYQEFDRVSRHDRQC